MAAEQPPSEQEAQLAMSQNATDSIRRLQEGTSRMAAGDLEHRIEIDPGDPLAALASQINALAAKYQSARGGLERDLETLAAERREAVEQQTALSDVLRIISESPGDILPVLNAVVTRAVTLCRADSGVIYEYDESIHAFHVRSAHGVDPELLREHGSAPVPFEGTVMGQTAAAGVPLQVPEIEALGPELSDDRLAPARQIRVLLMRAGYRSFLIVPLRREDRILGGLAIWRRDPGDFPQKVVALMQDFGTQSALAIQNAQLFRQLEERTTDLTEALEHQTALSDVLRIISESPGDVGPVLRTIAERAAGLCEAPFASVAMREGDVLHHTEQYITDPVETVPWIQTVAVTRQSAMGRAVLDGRTINVEDMVPLLDTEYPDVRQNQARSGVRAALAVPLRHENDSLGCLFLVRREPRRFTDKQVALVEAFADQAAIAVQNAQLFSQLEQRTRELEVASQHKSQFLANMSHELRTPLNAILGYGELILDGIYGDVPEKVLEVLDRVQVSGRHLLALINDVLDLSKIEAGQLTLTIDAYALPELLNHVVLAVEPLAAEKQLELVLEAAEDLPIGRGDQQRITQVFLNIVGNAVKFCEQGRVHLRARAVDGFFEVDVSDTGPGIAESEVERIFGEFQQGDYSSTKKKGGTGLGLAIARRFVEMHGGSIRVDSTPGTGSTFIVSLPVAADQSQVAL